MRPYRFASALAWRQCGCVNALVSLQGWRLREVFATNIAAVGLGACVAHAVAQQALGVGEGLCAHLQRQQQQSVLAVPVFFKHLLYRNKKFVCFFFTDNLLNNINYAEMLENLLNIMRLVVHIMCKTNHLQKHYIITSKSAS